MLAHAQATAARQFEHILPACFTDIPTQLWHSEALGGHALRVAAYSYAIARAYGFDESSARQLRQASMFHDIGKLLIPRKLLEKPSVLSSTEHLQVQQHTLKGHDLLKTSCTPVLQKAAVIALHHHEYLDGSGYPNKLRGAEIPLVARLVSVADVFDALTSERVYRPALSQTQTLAFIKRESILQFDPMVVEALLSVLESHPNLQKHLQAQTESHSDRAARHTRDESAALSPEQLVETWDAYLN